MALTQISTGGVKNDAVTSGKIPANAIGSSEIADDAVDQGAIADEAVDEARLQISNAGSNGQFLSKQSGNTGGLTWADANSYTHPNHSGEVTSTNDGATVIASNIVDEDNLKISNAGTNGQYLQKQSGNTGGLTWADVTIPPSGNTFTAVADGAIANNKPVTLKTNGKVAQIASSHAAAQPSAKDTEEMGQNGEYAVTVFDPDTNYVVCYNATGADVSLHYSTTLADSAGALASKEQTTVDVDGSGQGKPFTGSGNEAFHATYDTTNNRHVVCIISDYYFKSWLGSYSGSTLTFSGTATDPASANTGWKTPWIHHDPSTNRYVCAYIKTSNGTVYATQGTYNSNNNSITWGSEVSIGTGASSDDIAVCKASTTTGKLMVLWKDGSNEYGKGVIVTTSTTSTSLSAGSVQTWHSSALDNIRAVYNEEDNNVIATFGGNNEEISAIRLELDSAETGIDKDGTYVQVSSEQSHLDHRPIYSKAAKQVYVLYKNLNVSSSMYAKRITNTSGNPSFGSEVNIWSPFTLKNYTLGPGDSDPTSGCIFWAGAASNAGNLTLITSTRTTSASTNLAELSHYVGFADAAYSDGQTATIKTYGNHVDTLSGLTAGTEYYVHADGSLATSWDSNNLSGFASNTPLAGTALSASKLLIRDPRARA